MAQHNLSDTIVPTRDTTGQIREADIWTDRPSRGLFEEYWPQGVSRPTATPAVPDTLAWDLWLSPAPNRPYHPAYLPTKWRGWWDFGTGALGDIACHYFDPVFRALKLGAPDSVEASSTRVNEETYPVGSMITCAFPARGDMGAVKLVWYDGGLRPPRPSVEKEGDVMCPTAWSYGRRVYLETFLNSKQWHTLRQCCRPKRRCPTRILKYVNQRVDTCSRSIPKVNLTPASKS